MHLVPVGEAARQYTEACCRLVGPWMVGSQQEKALFVSHRGGSRLSLRSVSRIVLHAAQTSGVEKRITPHSFAPCHGRASAAQPGATCGTSWPSSGMPRSPAPSAYTHLSVEDLKEAVRRSHPHGRQKG